MRQTYDAPVRIRDAPLALAEMVGAATFLDIGRAVFDHEGIFAAEKRKLAVYPEGVFGNRLVFHLHGHHASLSCRGTDEKISDQRRKQQRKDQKKIPSDLFVF